jgi:multicomponent Na+:H+ antiporter subunit B
MDVIVRTVVKWMVPFILLLGISIMFHGHLTPGGSFPGGAVVASAFALVIIAFGIKKAERVLVEESMHIMESIVAMILALIIIYESVIRKYVGITGGMFGIFSSPEVLALNVVGGFMVFGALILVVLLMVEE